MRPVPSKGPPGAAGAAGATGPTGPAPSGTGLVSVTAGVLDTPVPLGLAGTLAARPAAGIAYLGRTYFANNVAPGGALFQCLTDGAGGYAWATIFLGSDGDVAGTAMVADGSDGVVKTGAVVSGLLAATTAAGMLAALLPSTAISLASATGWSTTTAGGTTSAIDTGTERAVLTVASGTATFTLASVARTTLPAIGRYSLQARIAAWTGIAATDTEQMLVRMTDSGGTLSDLWIYGTEAVSLTAGATVPGGAVTVTGLLTGQGWVRATVDGSQVTYACGVGSSGAAPTSWTTIGSRSTATAIMHPYTSFGVLIRRTVSQATSLVAELGTVSYRSLDL